MQKKNQNNKKQPICWFHLQTSPHIVFFSEDAVFFCLLPYFRDCLGSSFFRNYFQKPKLAAINSSYTTVGHQSCCCLICFYIFRDMSLSLPYGLNYSSEPSPSSASTWPSCVFPASLLSSSCFHKTKSVFYSSSPMLVIRFPVAGLHL